MYTRKAAGLSSNLRIWWAVTQQSHQRVANPKKKLDGKERDLVKSRGTVTQKDAILLPLISRAWVALSRP